MTLTEARDALNEKYIAAKKVPLPVIGVAAGQYEGRDCLIVYVNRKNPQFVPEESKPGAGFEGFEVVSYLGLNILISDSGIVP